jgi:peptidoglycan-associated lipoprotein
VNTLTRKQKRSARSALCALVFTSSLALVTCAPKTTPPPAPPPTPAPAPSSPSEPGAASSAPNVRESSSLEAARSGQSSATPETSPLKEIYFDYDRYDLRMDARDTLKAHAEWLKSNASARLEIEGHTDERGTNEYNLALGAKRAQSAKDYLVTLGIAANRISTISYGEELPVCKEASEACWQRNRRDRFVINSARPAS